jgi:hypothetical protein
MLGSRKAGMQKPPGFQAFKHSSFQAFKLSSFQASQLSGLPASSFLTNNLKYSLGQRRFNLA